MYKKKLSRLQAGNTRWTTLLLALVLLTTSASIAIAGGDDFDGQTIRKTITFSPIQIITEEDPFISITVEEADLRFITPGGPQLPRTTVVIPLPSDATKINVDFKHTGVIDFILDESSIVIPSPIAMPLTLPKSPYSPSNDMINPEIYEADSPYGTRFSYDIGVGIGENGEQVFFVVAHILPCTFTSVKQGQLQYIEEATVTVTYEESDSLEPLEQEEPVDVLILTANNYATDLQRLKQHKEEMGLTIKIVTLDEIYDEVYFEKSSTYARDLQEEIKYFIYQAVSEWDVQYVMAVGGYRSLLGFNRPNIQFPIRWVKDIKEAEEGYATELYYSCFQCYDVDAEEYQFDDWDTNNNDIFGEVEDSYDPFPDVYFGRLACRNKMELNTIIEKIITYETTTYDQDWFNRFLTIGGDGFQDLNRPVEDVDLGIPWDINDNPETGDPYPDGDYTIYAQSYLTADPSLKGNIDTVTVTIDRTVPTRITFEESDHEKIVPLDEEQETKYPGKPVAEIVVPSNEDILGNKGYSYEPPEAYCTDFWHWGDISYSGSILQIRTKSYDPSPKDDAHKVEYPGGPYDSDGGAYNFASRTNVSVWINNSDGDMVFGPVDRHSVLYYEGELGCQYAIDFMDDFEATKLWTSNGNFSNMWDVIDAISEGHGFLYMHGHSNAMSWMDHYPGIPGGRDDGGVAGLASINMRFGLSRYAKGEGDPLLPIDNLKNGDKLPIFLFSGCHSGQFDTSFMRLFTDPWDVLLGSGYGTWVPEGMAWWMTRIPQGGSIATIGNSALGFGYFGEVQIDGLGGWIYPEFLNQFHNYGYDILGECFTQTQNSYAQGKATMGYDRRTQETWTLLGDPSLKMGGYNPAELSLAQSLDEEESMVEIGELQVGMGSISSEITNHAENASFFDWEIRIDGSSPLGQFFGLSGTIIGELLRGRAVLGSYTSDAVFLSHNETEVIGSSFIFGLGHIDVNISVFNNDELVDYASEDGFLLGPKLLLFHGRE